MDRFGYPENIEERHISFAALNPTEMGTIDFGVVGEGLLGQV